MVLSIISKIAIKASHAHKSQHSKNSILAILILCYMHIVQQILFVLLASAAIFLFGKKISYISRNILLGRNVELNKDKIGGWRTVLLLAFGQKKMFRYPLVAV